MAGTDHSSRRADTWRACALVAGTLLIWWLHVIQTAEQPNGVGVGDLVGYFLPAYTFEASRLRAGAVPLWNPWQGGGVPFLAVLQPGALYPARLLLLVLSPATAAGTSFLAHLLLSVLATDRFCRRLGASGPASAIGGMVYGAAYAIPNVCCPSQLEPGAWLPVIGIGLLDVVEGRRGPALLAVALAMPLLAGGYQVAVYAAYGALLLALAIALDRRWRARITRLPVLARLACAGVLGVVTAAPQAAPTLAWSTQTCRTVGPLTDDMIQPGSSIPPIARLFHVQAFEGLFRRGRLPAAPAHLSVPVIALAAVGAASSGAFGVVVGAGVVAAVALMPGPGTPWFEAYRWLPGVSQFRFPGRVFVLVAFGAAVLSALGASWVAALACSAPLRQAIAASLLVLIFLVVVWPQRNVYELPWTTPRVPRPLPGFLDRLPGLVGAARASVPASRLDLGLGFYPRQATARGFRVLEDYEPLSARRLLDFLTAVAGDYRSPSAPYMPFAGAILDAKQIVRPQLLDLVAVRALVTPLAAVPSPPPAGWDLVERTFELGLFENRAALPRAYLVERARFVPDEAAALAAIVEPTFASREEAVLVGAPRGDAEAALALAPRVPFVEARIVRDDPEHVAVEVAPQRPGLLVLADAFAPGWIAAVDGNPRRTWQANQMVRAVAIRPGDRRVELIYHPPGFRPAVIAMVAAWALFGLVSLRRRDR
jgi:hypothetical protein